MIDGAVSARNGPAALAEPHASRGGFVNQLWTSRYLLRNYLGHDFKLKYRGSWLGFGWSLLNPVLMLTVLSVAFSFFFERSNYMLHLLATLVPWSCFAQTTEESCTAYIESALLMNQVAVSKVVFPLRRALFRICEFVIVLVALFAVASFYGFRPSTALLLLPLATMNLFLFSWGMATLAATGVVFFRDLQHLIGVGIRASFYLTPIIIPIDMIPEAVRGYFLLNPLYYIVVLFDLPISEGEFPPVLYIVLSTLIAWASFGVSWLVLRHCEDRIMVRI